MEEFLNFLIKAKKLTYAEENAEKAKTTRVSSKDYEITEEINGKKYTYHNTFFGGKKFLGSEVVYIDDEVKWA